MIFEEIQSKHEELQQLDSPSRWYHVKPGYRAPVRPFDLATDWDLDSAPDFVKSPSRALGARSGEVEAAINLGSLGHDIRYYYGGSWFMRLVADELFRMEIIQYSETLGGHDRANAVAWADWVGVRSGGNPRIGVGPMSIGSRFGFAWCYGFRPPDRRYTDATEKQMGLIDEIVWMHTRIVLDGRYTLSQQQIDLTTPGAYEQLERLVERL